MGEALYKLFNSSCRSACCKLRSLVVFSLIFFLLSLTVVSQTYPVTATTILVPPYSGYLQDYTNAGNAKLKLLLTLNDFSKPAYNVKIKFRLAGQNVTIQNKPYYYYGPVTLTPGVPLEISGDDLSQILSDNNLDFAGINYNQYNTNKILPEGFYSFCFTAYDYDNPLPVPVSQEACAFAWMTHCDPPFLNLPLCNSVIPVTMNNSGITPPQQITFNWTCNNAGCPSSIANTIYDFELYEIFPGGQNPNNIIQTSAPIYTASIQQTLLNYGITEPPLQFGREYCWRVRARDLNGYDYFKNGGWSNVCVFSYGSTSSAAVSSVQLSLNAEAIRYNAAKFSWSGNTAITNYRVEYRKTGNSAWTWFGINTSQTSVVATDLEAETQYEARLRGVTTGGDSTAWSSTETFTTPAVPQIACSDPNAAPSMANFSPLTSLMPNTNLQIGQFELRVTSLQSSSSTAGTYSGAGRIVMFGVVNVHVTFTNILVGSDYIVYQGEVHAVSEGVDSWVNNTLADQFGGNNTGDVVTGSTTADESLAFEITSILLDTTGTWNTVTITGSNGESETFTIAELPATFQGSDGVIYYVNENGEYGAAAQQNFMSPLNTSLLDVLSDKGRVTFSAYNKQYWGFDEWKNNFDGLQNVEREYQLLTNSAGTLSYHVPQKSIRGSGFDKVKFTLSNSQINADSILFVSSKGTRFFTSKTGNDRFVSLVGGPENDAQVIYALARDSAGALISFGKIKVPAYAVVQKEIVLVPVKVGNVTPAVDSVLIASKLNSYFKTACIKYKVHCQQPFTETSWDANSDGKLDISGSGLFSQYTAEMKALNSAFKSKRGKDNGTVYLFVLPQASEQGVAGDMPRSKQFGYLFASGNPNATAMARTTAHELGHGLFKLLHVFDNAIGFTQGSTNNLLDYSNDTCLYKFQWDQIHDPSTLGTLFDDDGEGQYQILSDLSAIEAYINPDNASFTFFSAGCRSITIPKQAKNLWFSTSDNFRNRATNKLSEYTPLGSLLYFELDGKRYNGTGNGNDFLGYYCEEDGAIYKEVLSGQVKPPKVIVPLACFENEKTKINFVQVENIYKENTPEQNAGAGNMGLLVVTDLIDRAELQTKVPIHTEEFFRVNTGIIVEVDVKPSLSSAAIQFLKQNEEYTHADLSIAPIILAHAHHITLHPVAEECSGISFANMILSPHVTDPNSSAGMQAGLGSQHSAKILYQQYDTWRNSNIDRYRQVESAIPFYDKILEKCKNPDSATTVLNSIPLEMRSCILEHLKFEARINALRLISQKPSIGEDDEELIVSLTRNVVKNGQSKLLLKELQANGNELFYALIRWDYWFDGLDISDLDEFVQNISAIVVAVAESDGIPLPRSDLDCGEEFIQYNGSSEALNNSCFSFSKESAADGTNYSFEESFANSGKIILKRKYSEHVEDLFDGDPFQILKFKFPSNNAIVGSGGDEFLAPAFYGAWVIARHNQNKNLQAARIVIDGIVIVVTVATDGATGSLLGIVDAAFAGTDLVIAATEEKLQASQEGQQFLDTWNTLSAVYGISTGSTFLVNSTKAVGSGLKRVFTIKTGDILEHLNTGVQNSSKVIEDLNFLAFKASNYFNNLGKVSVNNLLKAKFIYKLAELRLISKAKNLAANSAIKIRDNIVATALYLNTEYEIGNLAYQGANDFLQIKPSVWVEAESLGNATVIGRLEKVRYTKPFSYIIEDGDLYLVAESGGVKAYKVVTAGSADNIFVTQKGIFNQYKNIIANANSLRKGNFGEIRSDVFLTELGYEPVHSRIVSIDHLTHQGIDGVFRKGNEFFIVEAKYYGSASLSTLSDGTKQMSDAWISQNNYRRLYDAVGSELADDIILTGYKRLLAKVSPDGTVVFKELDANAKVIGTFNP